MGFRKMREAFEKSGKDEAGRLNVVQGIVLKSTGFLRRITAPAGGQGGVNRICAQIATVFLSRSTCGGFQLERSTAVGGSQSVEKKMIGERPTCCWWYKQVTVPVRRRCSRRLRYRKVL